MLDLGGLYTNAGTQKTAALAQRQQLKRGAGSTTGGPERERETERENDGERETERLRDRDRGRETER